MPRAAPASSSLLPLALAAAVVALAVSSCSATTDAPDAVLEPGDVVVMDDPKCEELVPCTYTRCIQYCISIGLQGKGFCNYRRMQVVCFCVIKRGPSSLIHNSSALPLLEN